MTLSIARKKFRARPLVRRKEPHAAHYLSERMTFWIAVVSVMAFVTGNMMGQHGWHVFWKSVLGGYDDSLIVYEGTVPPIARVPDYKKWALYGGSPHLHTFSEVPMDALVPLPAYDAARQRSGDNLVYSIAYLGSYETGWEASGVHPGVDIRVPVGTPVQSVMNGMVWRVGEDPGGFGTYVVIRHPRVPDPAKPTALTTLYSVYAHLSATNVTTGEIVKKGQQVALSGQTGFATGPHLHFQIDRDTMPDGTAVPYHPFWPFTSAEASLAGMSFTQAVDRALNVDRASSSTVHPMLYVQAQYVPVAVVAKASSSAVKLTPAQLRAQRLQARLAKNATNVAAQQTSVRLAVQEEAPVPVGTDAVVSSSSSAAAASSVSSSSAAPVLRPVSGFTSLKIDSPSSFSGRQWERVTVSLLDAEGNVITAPKLEGDLYLRTAYGKADFRPAVLTPLDFQDGVARVEMLPLGRTTVVVLVQPGNHMGKAIPYKD
ncbi:MAG: M23 family metallopeptidase [Candidatus Peribacteraceae bacterium]|nr:M23 family metallopeptidase [Candidatus Peribacteraceae bacterium]